MIRLLRRLWLALTWIHVRCDGCEGTGICAVLMEGKYLPEYPHSCCECAGRRYVAADAVPPGFNGLSIAINGHVAHALIGDGMNWARVWAPWRKYDYRPFA